MIRIGIGQDSHRLGGDKELFLGGIKMDSEFKVSSNSDGDAILHAICNALGSAIGLGSIGHYADKMCLEQSISDSREYVKYIFNKVREKGFKVQNVSVSVEAKKPKLEKYFPKMKKNIANLLEIQIDDVGITATSGEGLTAFGRGEGIQVFAGICIFKD